MTPPATISWMSYGWETAYAAVSADIDKALGHGVRTTNLTRRNNIEKVFSQGYRNAQKLVPKKYEGAITQEFVLANPWFFYGVLGSQTSSGSDPYTHIFNEADTIPSMTIENNLQTSAVRRAQLLGAKVSTFNLTSAVNELVRCRLDTPYAQEDFVTTTSSKVADSFDLYTFAHGSIDIPDGSTLAMVQNMDITMGNSPELVAGQGSRFAQEGSVKQRDYNGSITQALQASVDLIEKFYGQATGGPTDPDLTEVADMELNFTNGQTGTNERSIAILFTGVQFDEESMPQDPTQVIMEDVAIMMRSCAITTVNSTQTAP